jgi:hypothetical protein
MSILLPFNSCEDGDTMSSLVFLGPFSEAGVILLRINPLTVDQVHGELESLLRSHTEDELQRVFSVVESHRYRIRHVT